MDVISVDGNRSEADADCYGSVVRLPHGLVAHGGRIAQRGGC